MSRRHAGPGRTSLVGSAVLHGAVLVFMWVSSAFRPAPLAFESYAIELFSPPPAVEAPELQPPAPREEVLVEQPEAQPPAVEAPPPVPPPPQREPEPDPEPDPEPPPRREPEPRPVPPPPTPEPKPERTPEPARGPDPEPSNRGGENLNVRMEGLRRDYPEYYNNIVRQIQRCFRWTQGGRWQTVVYFVITREGSAADLRFVSQSGNAAFDFEALGAVECAGTGARFGPLPSDLPLDRLPVQFTFSPAGAGR